MRKSLSAIRLVLAVVGLLMGPGAASAQDVGPPVASAEVPVSAAPGAGRDLYLEVYINDAATGLIGNFRQGVDGTLSATADELTAVGLKPGDAASGTDTVRLDTLPQVSYRIDEQAQRLYVTTVDDARSARLIDLEAAAEERTLKAHADVGAVLNYSLFASSNSLTERDADLFQGISGGFDARVFGPLGTISQSFIAGYTEHDHADFTRLSTTWSYSDPARLLTYRAGDIVSGGLPWTRPVFLGGLQMARNFSLRSDLVTLPLPSFSGTAAVPSTLEIYAQNAQTYSGNVAQGPFQVVDLPAVTGRGEARVVLRDALGRETVTTLPYYTSNMMLRQGLLDFSLEAGFPRRNYGTESDDYDGRLYGVASARYGLTNWLTVEAHAEGGEDLLNGGLGVAFPIGTIGALSIAGAGSVHDGRSGALINAALELSYDDWTFYGRIQRAFGDYQDIASVTVDPASPDPSGLPIFSAGVPRAIDQVSVGVPLPLDYASLNLSYTHLTNADGHRSSIVGASYSQQVFKRSTVYATAFTDLDDHDSFGVFAGLSVPFDNDITASTGIEAGPDGVNVVADLVKSERQENGSVGWRVRASDGETTNNAAAVSYRSPWGRFEAGIQQFESNVRATAQFDGAIAVAGGDVFATNRIDDSFAVVDVGAPDVDVAFQNRAMGKTNRNGRILVPDLKSYQPNTVTIDPTKLPVDAEIPSTKEVVMPADRSGVVVKFGVSDVGSAAVVSFVDAAGAPIAAGLTGRGAGKAEDFVVGYDGEAYLRDLKPANDVSIEREDGTQCHAHFAYRAVRGEQVSIKDVVCQ